MAKHIDTHKDYYRFSVGIVCKEDDEMMEIIVYAPFNNSHTLTDILRSAVPTNKCVVVNANSGKKVSDDFIKSAEFGHYNIVQTKKIIKTLMFPENRERLNARYTLRRDDGKYYIYANKIAKLKKARSVINRSSINHFYGFIAYDNKLRKEVDIRTAVD